MGGNRNFARIVALLFAVVFFASPVAMVMAASPCQEEGRGPIGNGSGQGAPAALCQDENTGYLGVFPPIMMKTLAINITSPFENQALFSGQACEIKWNTTGGKEPYNVSLGFAESGSSGPYTPITDSLPGNGSCMFTMPALTELWLRTNVTDNSTLQQADSMVRHVYIQAPPPVSVSLTSPVAFAVWRGGGTYPINWTGGGGIPPLKVKLAYSMSLPYPASGTIKDSLPATGTFSWKLPMTLVAGMLQIIATIEDSAKKNVSASATVILLPPFIVMVTPTTANVLSGDTQMFYAQAYNYELNGSLTPINSGIVYRWNVTSTDGLQHGTVNPAYIDNITTFTATEAGSCSVNVIGMEFGSMAIGLPVTASVNVILPPAPAVNLTSPNGGERYITGGECNITWNITAENRTVPYSVQLMCSTDSGANYTKYIANLTQSAPGDNWHNWALPASLPQKGLRVMVTVTDSYLQTASDAGEGNFSISTPSHLRVYFGQNENGIVNRKHMPLGVVATDADEAAVSGVRVKWSISGTPAGATMQNLSDNFSLTDTEGKAYSFIHLGEVAGEYTVTATSLDIPGENAVFRVTALPDEPDRIVVTPGSAVLWVGDRADFSASVFDQYNNAITNRTVYWGVEGGIGAVANSTFLATAVGTGNVTSSCGAAIGKASIEVTSLPKVISAQPKDGAANVSIDGEIIVTFSQEMNTSSVQNAMAFAPPVKTDAVWTGTTVVIRPKHGTAMLSDTGYTFRIRSNCSDLAGNHLDGNRNGRSDGSPADDFVLRFTTGKELSGPPTVISYEPLGSAIPVNSSIVIRFSKPMNRQSVEDAFSLTHGGTADRGVFSWKDSDRNLTFATYTKLGYGTQYNVTIDGSIAKDMDGIHLDGNDDGNGDGTQNDSFIFWFVTAVEKKRDESGGVYLYLGIGIMIFAVMGIILYVLMKMSGHARKGREGGGTENEGKEAEEKNEKTEEKTKDNKVGKKEKTTGGKSPAKGTGNEPAGKPDARADDD